MKKRNVIFTLVFLLAVTSFAQQKTIVTVGGSLWNAEYSWEDSDGNKLGDIGAGNSVGPYISISHGKLNFGGSLLFGKFPVNQLGGNDLTTTSDIEMSRGDLNFTVGYRILRNINLFIGAKSLNWKIEGTVSSSSYEQTVIGYDSFGYPIYGYEQVEGQYNAEINESGVLYGLGISAVLPFGSSGMYGFASLAGMGGTLTNESKISSDSFSIGDTVEEDVTAALAAINVGIGYRTAGGLGLNVGYRADLFQETTKATEFEAEENPSIRVQGAIVTLSYSF